MYYLILSQAVVADNTTLYTGIMAVLTAMTGAITVMWRVLTANQKESERRLIVQLDKCESEHQIKDQWAKEISLKVGELQGTVKSRETVKQDLREITGEVVQKIDEKLDVVATEVAQAIATGFLKN